MEKPGKKLKKLFIILGTTGAVYAGLKYLLPLVAPFFAGYVLALILRPSARFLAYRLRIRFRGRCVRAPIGAVGGAQILILAGLLGFLLYRAGPMLLSEARLFMTHFPGWLDAFDRWLTGGCFRLEGALGLPSGCVADMAGDMLTRLADAGKSAAMPFLMTNSLSVAGWLARAAVVGLVTFLAAVLSLEEMEDLRDRRDQSLFRKEFNLIGTRLVQTGKAWFKTQGIILLAVTVLCVGGMFLMGNPYFIMAGIGIGILDALPIFGTGTVLLPWAVWSAVTGEWRQAGILAALYAVCYFMRQILEARMMGGQVGLSSLETLAAVYVGLELFGFLGVILGPLGLLLIEDLTDAWAGEEHTNAASPIDKPDILA